MITPGAKRAARKVAVRNLLLAHGPMTLVDICWHLGLSAPAVSRALVDIRNDPALEYATVATKSGGYLYRIAVTVEETKAGIRNQATHDLTRAESMIAAGVKLTKLAATPGEYGTAADVTANGRLMRAQALAILAALK